MVNCFLGGQKCCKNKKCRSADILVRMLCYGHLQCNSIQEILSIVNKYYLSINRVHSS